MADIRMVISQLFSLFGYCVNHLASAITDIDAVKTCKGIQQVVALHVIDIDAFTARHHPVWYLTTGKAGQVC